MLALADGISYREIARSLKTSGPTIARWKMRFEHDRSERKEKQTPPVP
jgi:transposase